MAPYRPSTGCLPGATKVLVNIGFFPTPMSTQVVPADRSMSPSWDGAGTDRGAVLIVSGRYIQEFRQADPGPQQPSAAERPPEPQWGAPGAARPGKFRRPSASPDPSRWPPRCKAAAWRRWVGSMAGLPVKYSLTTSRVSDSARPQRTPAWISCGGVWLRLGPG